MNRLGSDAQRLYQVLNQLENYRVSFRPSHQRIREHLGISEERYQQAINELVEGGFLTELPNRSYQIEKPPIQSRHTRSWVI